MAKMTLLQIVQNILSAMDSDEVNSIHDTVESQQVAEIVKETYYDLFSTITVPERVGVVRLESVSDVTRPNYLRLPSNVLSIDWVKYRDSKDGKYKDLCFLPADEFFERALRNSSGDDKTLITDESGVSYYIRLNQQPRYYTILNDKYLVADAFNQTYDSTLQSSKTFAWGEVEEAWENEDDFIPNLDVDLFPLFLSEAKSTCFITIKQIANQKEEQRSRRHRVHLQYRKWKDKNQRADEFRGVNYARNR